MAQKNLFGTPSIVKPLKVGPTPTIRAAFLVMASHQKRFLLQVMLAISHFVKPVT